MELNFIDPTQDYTVVERRLPHWSQAGVVTFLTWRTRDSLPREVVDRCVRERGELLRRHCIDPQGDWKSELERLPHPVRARIKWTLSERWDQSLDECHGRCLLRHAELSGIVAENLLHLDGQQNEMIDFVVMPNHVHVLATFRTDAEMVARSAAWRRYEARAIQEAIGESGHFWQDDGFDHLVRSPEQFEFFRRYIANNPVKARLGVGEYRLYSKDL